MKLYYFQGSCALAPHIVLEWSGADYELAEVKRSDVRSEDFLNTVNPFGRVPVLELPDGQKIHQVNALLLWLAEQFPETNLGPGDTQADRYAMQNLLSYFNGDVHTAFTPYFLTFRFSDDKEAWDGIKASAAKELAFHFNNLESLMADGREWVLGDRRTVLDPYLLVFTNWARMLPDKLDPYPSLKAFGKKMIGDAGVQNAMKAQGLIK